MFGGAQGKSKVKLVVVRRSNGGAAAEVVVVRIEDVVEEYIAGGCRYCWRRNGEEFHFFKWTDNIRPRILLRSSRHVFSEVYLHSRE